MMTYQNRRPLHVAMTAALLAATPFDAFAEERELTEVTVTGSRIKRTDLDSVGPVAP